MIALRDLKTASSDALLWLLLTILLTVGTLLTVIDLINLPLREARRANAVGQRAVIDPLTGDVAFGEATPAQAFDVGQKPEDKPLAESPAQPPPPAVGSGETTPEGLPMLRTVAGPTALPEVSSSKESLVPAPAPEVTEKTQGMLLPKRNGNATPAAIYAKRFSRTPEQKLVSFVVLDAGLYAESLPLIAALPKQVTVAFSAYAPEVSKQIASLRSLGFEVWGMLPMMGVHYPQDDPGPLGLVATQSREEMQTRLKKVMAATLGASGLVLPTDEALSMKNDVFSAVLAEIDGRGLNLLSTHPTHAVKAVSDTASPVRRAHVILDPTPNAESITRKLAEIPTTLANRDTLIVVLSAQPQTLELLGRWLKEHPPEAPITLAPLSAHWLPKEAPPTPEPEEKKSGGHH